MLRLLQINHPAIKRVGSSLMKPILALVAKKEMNLVPQLMKLTLQCISIGVKSLSGVMLSSLNGSVCDFILDRLACELDILTHNPLLLSASMTIVEGGNSGGKKNNNNNKRENKGNSSSSSSSNSSSGGGNQAIQSKRGHSTNPHSSTHTADNQGMNNSSNNCNDDRAADAVLLYCNEASRYRWLSILFEASESILVYCRHMLSNAVRERYSVIIRQGLISLSLGIVPSLYYDRHMQRPACAPIRSDTIVQSLLLQLATAEVFIPNSKQLYSQNLSLLQKVAELCMHSTATASAASKALMIISTLLQPTTVALPSIPFMDQARDFILQSSQQSRSHDDRIISRSGGSKVSIGEPVVLVDVDVDINSDETKQQAKRQKTVEVMNVDVHPKEIVIEMAIDQDEVEVVMTDDHIKELDEANLNDSSDGNQIVPVDQVLKIADHVYASNDDIHHSCTGSDVVGSIVVKHLIQQEILDNHADDDGGDGDDDDDSLPDIDIDADPDVN